MFCRRYTVSFRCYCYRRVFIYRRGAVVFIYYYCFFLPHFFFFVAKLLLRINACPSCKRARNDIAAAVLFYFLSPRPVRVSRVRTRSHAAQGSRAARRVPRTVTFFSEPGGFYGFSRRVRSAGGTTPRGLARNRFDNP